MIPGLSDEENVRILVELFGIDETRAQYVIAMERGDTDGDLDPTRPLTTADRRRLGLIGPIAPKEE
jgi:hypothetical protein